MDPCDDATCEPLTVAPVAALGLAVSWSVGVFMAWKFQPMQDLGHHMAIAAVVADRGREGLLYTALYEPFDPLLANSLLYLCAGYAGRLIGVTLAVRLGIAAFLAALPLATLYALRSVGRSAWAALLSVPFCYGMLFIAGVANMLFAAPLFVLALPLFDRALRRPSPTIVALTSCVIALVFLAHAHLFLWLGPLTIVMTLARLVSKRADGWKAMASVALNALVIVLPALLLFARWYGRSFGAGRGAGAVLGQTATLSEGYGAVFKPLRQLIHDLGAGPSQALRSGDDVRWLAVAVSFLVVSRLVTFVLERRAKVPSRSWLLELSCLATFAAYFVLPEDIQNQAGISSRHVNMALWLAPVFAAPVAASLSLVWRRVSIVAIVLLVTSHQALWFSSLRNFEAREAFGLDQVLAAAPPRHRLHYVKLSPESTYFLGGSWWHVEKFYMSDSFGFTADTTGIQSTGTIRYVDGAQIHRIGFHRHDWPRAQEIWDNFDLVLVHRWAPSAQMLTMASAHADRVAKAGEWELWRTRRAQNADEMTK
ncbi:MAG: hypothetical protein U0165_18835 [Polyangiaceae bacterium]